MSFSKTALFLRSIKFYRKPLLLIAFGVGLTAMIITGVFIIGDSVKGTLKNNAKSRTGKIASAFMTQERWFSADIANDFKKRQSGMFSSIIALPAYISIPDKNTGIAVNVYGVDDSFFAFNFHAKDGLLHQINENDVFINTAAKRILKVNKGVDFVLRVLDSSNMPYDAPLSKSSSAIVSTKLSITGICKGSEFGSFQLSATQNESPSVFMHRSNLAHIIGQSGKANVLLTDQPKEIFYDLKKILSLNDYGLEIRLLYEQWELTSKRVFIADEVVNVAEIVTGFKQKIFTYFVNEIRFGNKTIPYSFVSGIDPLPEGKELKDDNVFINQWTYDQLQSTSGTTLELKSYKINPPGALKEESFKVTVKDVLPMTYPGIDSSLMPRFPGFENTESCQDWDPDLPIDLSKVRKDDEEYWEKYKGSPKIILSLSKAQEAFANRFGKVTSIRFSKEIPKEKLIEELESYLQPEKLGFRILDVNKQNNEGLEQGVDFAGLFAGLSFFIIIAAIILTTLLYSFYIDKLHKEYAVLNVLGFDIKTIWFMYLLQGMLFSLIGVIPGALSGCFYGWAVLHKLNTVWAGAVNQTHIELYISSKSLIFGGMLSFIAVFIALGLQIIRFIRSTDKNLLTGEIALKKISYKRMILSGIFFATISLILLIYINMSNQTSNIGYFILLGFAILAALTQIAGFFLIKNGSKIKDFNLKNLALKNCSRRFDRTMAVIRLISVAIFLTLAVGLNQQSFNKNHLDKSSGTGGFTHYVETAVPITKDMNSSEGKEYFKLSELAEDITFNQLPTMKQSDASCLNLNHVVNPNISGISPVDFKDRFSFKKILKGVGKGWEILDYTFDETDIIPAVADMDVIEWSLGKKIGEDLSIVASNGTQYRLRFVGGLKNSIFQGRVLISLKNFYKLFPDSTGTDLVLFSVSSVEEKNLLGKLTRTLANNGLNLEKTDERMNKFSTVQNTYLAVFFALGGIGLILGCGGLVVLIQRNMYERRDELTYLQIAGYSPAIINKLLFYEYFGIFILSVFCGIISAIVAIYPSLISLKSIIILKNAIALIALFVLLGLFSIFSAVHYKKKIDLNIFKE